MKTLTLILILFLVSCTKQYIQPDYTPVSLYGKYAVQYNDKTWTWEFNDGKLTTITDSSYNACGLYFYSNHTDTIVVVAGNLEPQVYRGIVLQSTATDEITFFTSNGELVLDRQ